MNDKDVLFSFYISLDPDLIEFVKQQKEFTLKIWNKNIYVSYYDDKKVTITG